MRITMAHLQAKVDQLNTLRERPLESWTKTDAGCKANVGNYHLSGGYGHTFLCVMANDLGGVRILKSGTKQDVADYIDAFIAGYLEARN